MLNLTDINELNMKIRLMFQKKKKNKNDYFFNRKQEFFSTFIVFLRLQDQFANSLNSKRWPIINFFHKKKQLLF